MADNFFLDNPDLVRIHERLDLSEVVEMLEDGFRYHLDCPDAPRSWADAHDTHGLVLQTMGEICATRIAPRAEEAATEGARLSGGRVEYAAATRDALADLRRAGLMGALLPREYGGLNLPEALLQMQIELVSRAEAGLMTVYGLQEISATIAEFGDDAMKERLLPRFARGEVTGAMVLTEPDAGSDLGAVQTRATLGEDGVWRLRGVKRFITNGNADVLLVLARSEEGSTDARGLSLYAVEADDTVLVRRLENKMGLRASPTCEIEFRDTPAWLVGKRRFGLIRYAMGMMNGARLAVAAQSLGIAEAACREAEAYAARRAQFGQPIAAMPAVRRMLTTMRGEIEATRSLMYEAARWVDLKRGLERRKERGASLPEDREALKAADRLAGVLTPLVKYHASEMVSRVCHQAIQVHGGSGYMREYAVERHYRDARVTSIYEGTSQLQVVAAIGPLLGGALDDRLAEWEAASYGPGLSDLAADLRPLGARLRASAALLSPRPREEIDFYAVDLVDWAAHLAACWLTLRDSAGDERKEPLARAFVAYARPRMVGWADTLECFAE